MNTSIGVKITHPRYDYARLSFLNRAQVRTRHFMTLSPGQQEADVEIHLIRKTADLEYRSLKVLHHFHLQNLPVEQDQAISLSIRCSYDGNKIARIDILYQNQLLDTAELNVRPDRTVPWLIMLAAVLLLFALVGGGTAVFRGINRQMRRNSERGTISEHTVTEERLAESVTPLLNAEPIDPVEQSAVHEETREPELQPDPAASARQDSPDDTAEKVAPAPVFDDKYIIYFSPNQTYITAEAEVILTSLADKLLQDNQVHISAEGHTADYGNFDEQLEISRLRVVNTLEFLTDAGWDPDGKADAAWFGPNYPVTRERDRQHENRRVEIRISGDPEN